ncbi:MULTISPECIES: GntR family transcriptional regulator [unclassified Agrococcus]|uniref:GntR family transcriptional regulator n=1 Tax=unclassified Agrococcus TaxID=2615065 RepID=UPI00360A1CD8
MQHPLDPPSPPRRGHAASDAATALRRRIVDGELLPGARLVEGRLADELGVSRNTLREAFRALAGEGLVAHAANRGARVPLPTAASVRDVYRVRRAVELQTLREADANHRAVASMRRAVAAGEAALAADDARAMGSADLDFHRAIVALADSPRMTALLESVLGELRLAFGAVDDLGALHGAFLADNAAIVAALAADGPAAATALLERYLARSERMVLDAHAARARADEPTPADTVEA